VRVRISAKSKLILKHTRRQEMIRQVTPNEGMEKSKTVFGPAKFPAGAVSNYRSWPVLTVDTLEPRSKGGQKR